MWSDPAQRTPDPDITTPYGALKTLAPTSNHGVTTWTSRCRIVINYIQHIQPLWELVPHRHLNGDGVRDLDAGGVPDEPQMHERMPWSR